MTPDRGAAARPRRQPGEPPADDRRVAYFTMEAALDDELPTFSGGLGVLAGDFLRAGADLGLPLLAVTLCYRGGYFRQQLDSDGGQAEAPVHWEPEALLEPLDVQVSVEIAGRAVEIAAWRYVVEGVGGQNVPVYLLDTALSGNDEAARSITARLYGGDERYRLEQEAVLGIGGVELLTALGHHGVERFHMNEGHSSLLTLRLLERSLEGGREPAELIEDVRRRCVFTTHTPVPAGHDRFSTDLVAEVLGEHRTKLLDRIGQLSAGQLNMTELGMGLSGYVNAVSLRHAEVTRAMFPGVEVRSVTNGVHPATWCAPSTARVLDEHVPGWRGDSAMLHYATAIPLETLRSAHDEAKAALVDLVRHRCGRSLAPEALTIGIARRATPYKQTSLIFTDLDRLRRLSTDIGPLQIVCSGKAHPRDEAGKGLIMSIVEASHRLAGSVEVVFLEDYDLELGRILCAGTDVWLNTPQKPHEASGTSGMKAALNGVPSLSTLDGWWLEGWIEGVTGWAIGGLVEGDDAAALYEKLETVVTPLYYERPDEWVTVMRHAIALNGSFFNTQRMAAEYAVQAYGLPGASWRPAQA